MSDKTRAMIVAERKGFTNTSVHNLTVDRGPNGSWSLAKLDPSVDGPPDDLPITPGEALDLWQNGRGTKCADGVRDILEQASGLLVRQDD